MDFIGRIKNMEKPYAHTVNITLETTNTTVAEILEKYWKKNNDLNISIKRKSQKRSLDSNSLAWYLMEEIAKVIQSDKDIVYKDMLGKYGVFTHIIVKQNVVDRIKEEWKLVKELGEVTINGVTGIQLQCYFGSSTYTQLEMSRFINGIVNECHDYGIATPEDNEISTLIQEWGSK